MAGMPFYVLILFHKRDVFCTLSRLFVRPGFRFLCACLVVRYLAVYSVSVTNSNGDGNEYSGCVSVRYNSLFISLPLFTKGHQTTFCIFIRT